VTEADKDRTLADPSGAGFTPFNLVPIAIGVSF
jgi:hypothetical protein